MLLRDANWHWLGAGRPIKPSPLHALLKSKGAVHEEVNGFEQPRWFARGIDQRDHYSFNRTLADDMVAAEVKAVRENVGIMDVTAFTKVLIRVGTCGLNNTGVNTRLGWCSKTVTEATTGDAFQEMAKRIHLGAPITFPRIQGADVCGVVIAVGAGGDAARVEGRVITDGCLRDAGDLDNITKTSYFGPERDGGFAQYTITPARNALRVQSDLSDAELATFSCSDSTAEGMLTRALGLLPRVPNDLRAALGRDKINVVADVVGGPSWTMLIDVPERGGRYTCAILP